MNRYALSFGIHISWEEKNNWMRSQVIHSGKYLSATCARVSIESFFLHFREHCRKVTAKNLSFVTTRFNEFIFCYVAICIMKWVCFTLTVIYTYITEVVLDLSSRFIDFVSFWNVDDLSATPAPERFHYFDRFIKPCVQKNENNSLTSSLRRDGFFEKHLTFQVAYASKRRLR